MLRVKSAYEFCVSMTIFQSYACSCEATMMKVGYPFAGVVDDF